MLTPTNQKGRIVEKLIRDKNGNLLNTCDDMQRIYYFNNPEK